MTDFKTWSQESLADFARDSFKRIQEQDEAIEQLRQDFADAMELVRLLNSQTKDAVKEKNTWNTKTLKIFINVAKNTPTIKAEWFPMKWFNND